jgi:hypothetical protein
MNDNDLTPQRLSREAERLLEYFERRKMDPAQSAMVMAFLLSAVAAQSPQMMDVFADLTERMRTFVRTGIMQ